jgi:hypothetical protein
MNLRESVYSLFSWLSGLYPKEYRKKYSKDMKLVFLDILEDSGSSGGWHAVRALLDEFACLPGCLIREYFAGNGGSRMNSSRRIITVTASRFLLLFLLLSIEFGVLRIFSASTLTARPEIRLLLLLLNGILNGLLIGGTIGWVLSIDNKIAMMIACGMGYVPGTFLTGPSYWEALGIPVKWINGDWEAFFIYAASPLTGMLIGLMAGWLWRGWKAGIIVGLASSMIFTVGFWMNYASWQLLFGRGMDLMSQTGMNYMAAWNFICWIIGYALFGGIVGILWGVLLDRIPRMQSLMVSEMQQ